MDKSPWQQELDALPEWVQNLVLSLKGYGRYGFGLDKEICGRIRDDYTGVYVSIRRNATDQWHQGIIGALALAQALSAPWPPPAPPAREKRASNVVEIMADTNDEEGGGFDQPCCFGNRVGFHATYCHNTAWPDSPRKCHRNRSDYRHENCPGFVGNPDYEPPKPTETRKASDI